MKPLFLIAGCLLTGGLSWTQQYVISTFAGGAPPPSAVPAVKASIGRPSAVATASTGNVYFISLNCVFKIDQDGVLTRIAGNSRSGYSGDGGPAANAQLADVAGLVVDGYGNLLIADFGNNRIRRVSPEGIITTIAGDGGSGFSGDDGPATSAHLGSPLGVAVDASGNVFVTDIARVRKISPNGIITTIAGDGTSNPSGDNGPAKSARLGNPDTLATDNKGNLFIGDSYFNTVRRISADGIITTVAILRSRGLATDQFGNLYIVFGQTITKVSTDGTQTTVAGNGLQGFSGDGGPATKAALWGPDGVAVDVAGNIFIGDSNNFRVRKVDSSGIITTIAGGSGYSSFGDGTPAVTVQLQSPQFVAVDSSGNVFIADSQNTVRKVSASGVITTVAGGGRANPSDGVPAVSVFFGGVTGLAIDQQGNLYIADGNYPYVRKVSPDGLIKTIAGNGIQGLSGDGGPAINARLDAPSGLAVDGSGNLFIADSSNSRIRKVSPDGIITTIAGTTFGYSGDNGLATSAQLATPHGVAVDGSGNLFIADTQNARIRKVSADGVITTVAGYGSFGFGGDGGPATAAQLDHFLVTVDRSGNLFITDSLNNRVRKVSAGGIITTIAGSGAPATLFNGYYSGDGGAATSAALFAPTSAAVDTAGNVYVADFGHDAVRVLRPATQSVWIGAIADAASEEASPLSPGKIVVLYGKGLGPSQLTVASGSSGFTSQLAGTRVSFNGVAAPLIYTSDTQAAAIVPYSISGTTIQVTAEYQGQTSATVTVAAAASAPSLFTSNGTGSGQAAAINAVGLTPNTAANPVNIGGYISLYATGEGQTDPSGIDGRLGDLTATHPLLPVSVTVGGVPATVLYSGGVFGNVAGLMQINVQIPAGVQPGGYVPVVVKVGDASSGPGTWIAVTN